MTRDLALEQAVSDALLSADEDPEGRAILRRMDIERYEPIDDPVHDSIRPMKAWIAARAKP